MPPSAERGGWVPCAQAFCWVYLINTPSYNCSILVLIVHSVTALPTADIQDTDHNICMGVDVV